ncbi:MAG: DUF1330 domain-containing protein [Bauldia sp.]|nr:DUF1330 domain-containing protein [Bauldia sp.]
MRLLFASLAVAAAIAVTPATAQTPSPPQAYTIVEIEITDPQLFAEFGGQLRPLILAAGGLLVTMPSGNRVVHEGEPMQGVGITIWPSLDAATAFYTSQAFLDLIPLRDRAANLVRIVTVEGLPVLVAPVP